MTSHKFREYAPVPREVFSAWRGWATLFGLAAILMAMGAAYEWSFQRIRPAVEDVAAQAAASVDAATLSGSQPRYR